MTYSEWIARIGETVVVAMVAVLLVCIIARLIQTWPKTPLQTMLRLFPIVVVLLLVFVFRHKVQSFEVPGMKVAVDQTKAAAADSKEAAADAKEAVAVVNTAVKDAVAKAGDAVERADDAVGQATAAAVKAEETSKKMRAVVEAQAMSTAYGMGKLLDSVTDLKGVKQAADLMHDLREQLNATSDKELVTKAMRAARDAFFGKLQKMLSEMAGEMNGYNVMNDLDFGDLWWDRKEARAVDWIDADKMRNLFKKNSALTPKVEEIIAAYQYADEQTRPPPPETGKNLGP
jgi:hypothetical protein